MMKDYEKIFNSEPAPYAKEIENDPEYDAICKRCEILMREIFKRVDSDTADLISEWYELIGEKAVFQEINCLREGALSGM